MANTPPVTKESFVTFVPLTRLPWRSAVANHHSLPRHWSTPSSLLRRVDAWRRWLEPQPGGRWLLCQRHPESFCAALVALWESGRIAVLPPNERPETLAQLAKEVDGRLPIEPGGHAADDREIALPVPEKLSATATALILHTSGSTGAPVRLAKRFDQLDAELAAHVKLWPLAGSGVISQVSHQHIYGLLTGILRPLCAGVPFCGDESRYPEGLVTRLEEANAAGIDSVVISSPAQLSRLPAHLPWPAASRIKWVFSSGAPLHAEHAQHAERLLQAPVFEIYGSTETGGIAQRRQQQSTTWQPLPGVELGYKDEQLTLRSPFLEYPQRWWQQPDRVVLRTSGFELQGRTDRLVKIAGKRVSLNQIERILATVEGVIEARCARLEQADDRLGVVVMLHDAYIPHRHDSRHQLIQQLRKRLACQLEPIAIPRYWRFVDAMPSNPQGKLDHSLVKRLFADLDNAKSPRWLGEQRSSSVTCRLTLEVPERLVFLHGHFDEYPLVPGVVIVQWVMELATESFGELGNFHGIERLKFRLALRPGTRFTLQLTQRTDGIIFTLDSHEGRHCSGQIRLQPANPVEQPGNRHG